MKTISFFVIGFLFATLLFSMNSPFRNAVEANNQNDPIIGTWFVKTPEAPFKYHMFVFNSDGTMQQANPAAGDPNTSDSDGKGIWVKDGNKIKGKFVEVTADRTTHAFVSRGEIAFDIAVDGDKLAGSASARFYDEGNKITRQPISATLTGTRVTLP